MEPVRDRSGHPGRSPAWSSLIPTIAGGAAGVWVLRAAWTLGVIGALVGFVLGLMAKPGSGSVTFGLMLVCSEVAFLSVGTLVVSRQPSNRIGLLFFAIGLFLVVATISIGWSDYGILVAPGSLPFTTAAAWIGRLVTPLGLALFIPAFLLFPDGQPPTRRWRPVVWAWLIALPVTILAWVTGVPTILIGDQESRTLTIANPTYLAGSWDRIANLSGTILALTALATVAALVVRFRRARGDERQQIRWLMVVGVAFFLAFVVLQLILVQVLNDADLNGPIGENLFLVYASILLIGLPAAAGVAILKYRLYDLDLVIRKAVIATVLTLFVAGAYVAIVAGIGSLAGAALVARIAATALVAIAFQPVRERATRFANRLVYGRRATPYEVLARFSERVGGTYEADTVLPRLARVIAEGTGAASAEVWLRTAGSLARAAAWPEDVPAAPASSLDEDGSVSIAGRDRVAPVVHQGEMLGAISITKAPGEPLTVQEAELVDRLADQAGLVVANVRLSADLEARLADIARRAAELRASAQRIVAAQDEERRRLERNIHDGAQQHLVALAVKLRLTRSVLAKDPEKGWTMLTELRGQVDAAIETLRSLALGVYPPLLEEQGIAAALAAQYTRGNLPVRMRSDGVRRYPIEVEAAVYFCVLEALQNAAKYAAAGTIEIALEDDGRGITFQVSDDGRGFDPGADDAGTGLAGMLDRVAVFGGEVRIDSAPGEGTTVRGRIPATQGVPA